jgi:hypothetical protein
VAAITLLVIGVVRQRRFLFIASFVVLPLACMVAVASDESSEVYNFIGAHLMLCGLVCALLSWRLKPGGFISRPGLADIGVLLFVLGFFGTMIC